MTAQRLAVLGAGAMGRRIADGAVRSGRFHVTAVVDPDPIRARDLAERHGAVPFADVTDPRLAERVDAVYVGTPNGVRVEICELAASAGWHLLIDKPMCGTLAEADTIAALLDGTGLTWMIGFSYRFRAEWRRAQELIAAGLLGAPLLVCDVIVESSRDTPRWYWDDAAGGGVLQLQSHHCFDRVRWLLDRPITSVRCAVTRADATAEQAAVIAARLGSGASLTVALGFATTYEAPARTLFVAQGTDGMIQIDDARAISITDARGTRRETYVDDDWLVTELRDFADAIAGSCTGYPSVADGRRALQTALEAARSAASESADGEDADHG